jgi:hypothetical protein
MASIIGYIAGIGQIIEGLYKLNSISEKYRLAESKLGFLKLGL